MILIIETTEKYKNILYFPMILMFVAMLSYFIYLLFAGSATPLSEFGISVLSGLRSGFYFTFINVIFLFIAIFIFDHNNTIFFKLIILLEVLKFVIYFFIAYLVIWGLIIEPHLSLHYYGVSDMIEFAVALLLILPIRWINSLIGFFHAVTFFGKGLNPRLFSVIRGIRKFGKNFKLDRTVVFNESFTNGFENRKQIYLVMGFTVGIKFGKAYCFGWSFGENDKDIDLYRFTYTNDKPLVHKFNSVPAGSECDFSMEYRDRVMIKWKLSTKEGETSDLIFNDELMTSKRFHWGVNLNGFMNSIFKDGDKAISTSKPMLLLNNDLYL